MEQHRNRSMLEVFPWMKADLPRARVCEAGHRRQVDQEQHSLPQPKAANGFRSRRGARGFARKSARQLTTLAV